jgi:O-methyltransferase
MVTLTIGRKIGLYIKDRVDPATYVRLRSPYTAYTRLKAVMHRAYAHHSYRVIDTDGHPLKYRWDSVFTIKSGSFMTDERFERAWRLAQQRALIGRRDVRWRAHIFVALADMASRLDGDMVECGTFRGIYMHTAAEYLPLSKLDKTVYLFDTWTGLSAEHLFVWEKERARRIYNDCFEEVKRAFAHVPNIRMVRGPVPDTLAGAGVGRICFLHLDMNCTLPEKAALEFFWDKLVPGGVVLSDDYGDVGYEGQKKMYEDFAAAQGLTLLTLPTGQAVLFKPPAVKPNPTK